MPSYKEITINLANAAREIMLNNFTLDIKKAWKEDSSPVTETDKTINSLTINTIKQNFSSL